MWQECRQVTASAVGQITGLAIITNSVLFAPVSVLPSSAIIAGVCLFTSFISASLLRRVGGGVFSVVPALQQYENGIYFS